MRHSSILDRIHDAVGSEDYLVPTMHLGPAHRAALQDVATALRSPTFDRAAVVSMIEERHQTGEIDRVMMLSALGVVAASPQVSDYAEASRLAALQEYAALERRGPDLDADLASVDRHRGVLAFLMRRYDVALEWFTSALERQRTAENLGNVLSALIRLGELDDAIDLLDRIRTHFPEPIRQGVEALIAVDDDLRRLRS